MKYLVMCPIGPKNAPKSELSNLAEQAQLWLEARLSSGKFDCAYGLTGGGGIVIANAPSRQSLDLELRNYPLAPFLQWQIYPLYDLDESFKVAAAILEREEKERRFASMPTAMFSYGVFV